MQIHFPYFFLIFFFDVDDGSKQPNAGALIKKKITPHPNCLLICQEHMLREVKIHDSALLPKVQFNPGKKRRWSLREEGARTAGFMTDLSETVN